mgnify:CR=1 FL=1
MQFHYGRGRFERKAKRKRQEMNRKNKYGAKKTIVDGVTFASKKEAKRYCELKYLVSICAIQDLELQPKVALMVNGKKIGHYIGDFAYVENGNKVIEDVKSKATVTPVYRLKKKILETYDPPVVIRELF